MTWAAIASAAGAVITGYMSQQEHKDQMGQIRGMTDYNPMMFGGLGGQIGYSNDGSNSIYYKPDASTQGMLDAMRSSAGGLAGGGMFGMPQFQQALQGTNLSQGLTDANNMLMQQAPGSAFGGLGAQYGGAMGLAGQFGNALSSNTFGQTQANELASLRAAAQPEQNRMFNKLQDSLFAKGMLGTNTTQTGEAFRGLQEAFGQQDLNFQNEAFNRAMGQRQFQLGGFNQMMGLGAGLEGQAFGQGLSALQQNQTAGQQRLANMLGMFSTGQDFLTSGAQGSSALSNAFLNYMLYGSETGRGLLNAEANRIGATGLHAQGIGGMGSSGAAGLFGGAAEGLIGLLGSGGGGGTSRSGLGRVY